jgi:hypothetical protein
MHYQWQRSRPRHGITADALLMLTAVSLILSVTVIFLALH